MPDIKVQLFSHYFAVHILHHRAYGPVREFGRPLIIMKWEWDHQTRRNRRVPSDKAYAAGSPDKKVVRYHIGMLEKFKTYLKAYRFGNTDVEYEVMPYKELPVVDIPLKPEWVPKPIQEEGCEFILKEGSPNRLLGFGTGVGKSFTMMLAGSRIKRRICFLFRAGYMKQWLEGIRRTYDIEISDCMVVGGKKDTGGKGGGTNDLKKLLQMVVDGTMHAKVILISNRTFQLYLNAYKEQGEAMLEDGWACTPVQFFEFLGIGLRAIDEVHLDFHLNFNIDLHTHVYRSVSASATLVTDDEFVREMHQTAYPMNDRLMGPPPKQYTSMHTVLFQFMNPDKIKYVNWANGNYFHNAYEQSIMKYPKVLENYTKLILWAIRVYHYRADHKPGDKCVLFFASVEMCTHMTEAIAKTYPDLNVKRYVGSMGDNFQTNCVEPDFRITTHGSMGTAVDIKGLSTVIMTIAMRSSAGGIQNLGRLREMDDGRSPAYAFIVNSDNPKHMEYHRHRMELLEARTASMRVDRANMIV